MIPQEEVLPWMAASHQKPQAPAEEEVSTCITDSKYSPLVQEVLEAQLCLLVPSPPAKPNPFINERVQRDLASTEVGFPCVSFNFCTECIRSLLTAEFGAPMDEN